MAAIVELEFGKRDAVSVIRLASLVARKYNGRFYEPDEPGENAICYRFETDREAVGFSRATSLVESLRGIGTSIRSE